MAQDPAPEKALAVVNWTTVSRTMYYNIPYNTKLFLIDNIPDRFAKWITGSPLGYDLLFLNNHFSNRDVAQTMKCGEVRNAGSLDLLLNGGKVDTVDFVWCKSFGGVKAPESR